MDSLTITRPDDWHLHLRDDAEMADVVGYTGAQFSRAMVMPNLAPPVTTTQSALAYRKRIIDALPEGADFQPLMTLYLTDNTPPEEIVAAKNSGQVYGIKLYPAGVTTNSDAGVTDLDRCTETLEKMAETGLPLQVHGEVTDPDIDIFDREAVFIDRVLAPLHEKLPALKIIFEHVTTTRAVEFVNNASQNIAATITPQHLLYNRNALFNGGLRPHYYCLPILKLESDRQTLVRAATSGASKYFLGTDSAPHSRLVKEKSCGCAGIFSAPAALEMYAEAFDRAGKLDKLEYFASHAGPDFYDLPRNTGTITLYRNAQTLAEDLPFGDQRIVPFRAGETLNWST
ncbi:MAG: dihydroorotase [Gammaproteobacteria bacterium]